MPHIHTNDTRLQYTIQPSLPVPPLAIEVGIAGPEERAEASRVSLHGSLWGVVTHCCWRSQAACTMLSPWAHTGWAAPARGRAEYEIVSSRMAGWCSTCEREAVRASPHASAFMAGRPLSDAVLSPWSTLP